MGVLLGVRLSGFGLVVLGLDVVAVREMGVVRGLLVVASGMVLVRLVMVLGGVLVVLGGVRVMLAHGSLPSSVASSGDREPA